MTHFIGYILDDTPRAIIFQDHHWHAPQFMPKSQCTLIMSDDSTEVQLIASDWITKQKELVEFVEIELPEEESHADERS